MKKTLLTSFMFVFLTGCNTIEANLVTENNQSISYTYSENAFLHSMYLTRIFEILHDNSLEYDRKVEALKNYSQGFKDGTSRRNIYNAVEPMVYSELSQVYDEQIINRIKSAHLELYNISNQVINFINQKKINNDALQGLSNKLEAILPLLYPKNENKELTLYNLLAHPKDIMENNNKEQVNVFLEKMKNEMDQLRDFLKQNTTG